MPTISAVLIVKNEAKVIERCLKSLHGVDEIIVLDTGSSDKTASIARAYTRHVIGTPLIIPFHFAEARNRADGYASSDWILTIDADEVLAEGAFAKIKDELSKIDTLVSALRVKFIFSDEDGKNTSFLRKLKVYRRGDWKWHYRVHEILKPVIDAPLAAAYVDAQIIHVPDPEKSVRRRQNLKLLKLSVEEDPGYLRNIRQLGMEYYLLEQWSAAVDWLEKYLQKSEPDPLDFLDRSEVSVYIGKAHAKLSEHDAALESFDRAIGLSPGRREPYYWKAVRLIDLGRLDEALIELERCLAVPAGSMPEFHLNIEDIWNGKLPEEAIAFCKSEIETAKAKLGV
jgi:glycosyltransferase involved in cell wall biosynthesis